MLHYAIIKQHSFGCDYHYKHSQVPDFKWGESGLSKHHCLFFVECSPCTMRHCGEKHGLPGENLKVRAQ